MIDPRDQPESQAASSGPRSSSSRTAGILGGLLALIVGILLAGVMTVAVAQEFLTDDFYGGLVAAMVVVFGLQLVKLGYCLVTGRQMPAPAPSQMDRLWDSEVRVYPYRHYSYLEIRGR